jgi:hypothetical protein
VNRRSIILLLALFAAPSLTACGGRALSTGEAQFHDGHYPAAKQSFSSLEASTVTWDDATVAEYCVYRGLTYQALGDEARAELWLRRAKAMDDARPGLLGPGDASRLRLALASIAIAR